MAKGDNQEYTWTVADIRKLDARLSKIESCLQEVKRSLKPHAVVVSPANTWSWKAIAVIIGSTIATILLAVQQVTK